VDDHRYSVSALAPWRFWGEDQSKAPEIRQLDPYSDHSRDHPGRFKITWDRVIPEGNQHTRPVRKLNKRHLF
jgi:hypothetical protein